MRTSFVILSLLTFILIAPSSALAVQQVVDVTINPDFSATGVWSLPVDERSGGSYQFEEFKNFGATGVMNYSLRSVANSEGELPLDRSGGAPTLLNVYKGAHPTITNLNVTYDIKTALTKPLAVYEIWVAGAGFFNAPVINVTYPKDWKLLSYYPSGTDTGGSLSIQYPQVTSYVRPVILVFVPSQLGAGNTMTTVGRFTVVGDTASVKRLTSAIQKMTFLDDVMQQSLGSPAPSSVILYAGDLRNVDVGYEAVALAARPNIILYNRDILASQSSGAIQTTILHETTHLVEQAMELFKGATYIAPWFKEGIAVFVENQGRSKIYPSTDAMAVADAFNDSHLMTPSEFKEREKKTFDMFFNGDYTISYWNSYSMAGAALTRVFHEAGVTGMQKVFAFLKNTPSNQILISQDSEHILQALESASGLQEDAILHPYKESATFDADATSAGVVRPEYSESDINAIVAAIKKLPQYVAGATQPAANSDDDTSATAPQTIVAPPVVQNVISAIGSFFDGKKKATSTPAAVVATAAPAASTDVSSSSATSSDSKNPEPKHGWIETIVNFFLGLLHF